jgi:hypothetical protein
MNLSLVSPACSGKSHDHLDQVRQLGLRSLLNGHNAAQLAEGMDYLGPVIRGRGGIEPTSILAPDNMPAVCAWLRSRVPGGPSSLPRRCR